jgi:hypothetical protein
MNYLYSNLKQPSTIENIDKLKKMNLKGLIVDFGCDETLCKILNSNDIKENYYRIKLYDIDINTNYNYVKEEIEKAYKLGFFGFAIDAESYSQSKIWQYDQKNTFEFGEWLGNEISKYFNDLIIYPENLGGEKYLNYDCWLRGICRSNLNIKLLLERTYEVWKPWELYFFYNRTKKAIKEFANIEIVVGIWYESMVECKFYPKILLSYRKILAIIPQLCQFLFTKFFKYRFYYSETTEFLHSKWLMFLSK